MKNFRTLHACIVKTLHVFPPMTKLLLVFAIGIQMFLSLDAAPPWSI
jgi:hypothetical protein